MSHVYTPPMSIDPDDCNHRICTVNGSKQIKAPCKIPGIHLMDRNVAVILMLPSLKFKIFSYCFC